MTTSAPELVARLAPPRGNYAFKARLIERKDGEGKLVPGSLNSSLTCIRYREGRPEAFRTDVQVDPRIEWRGHLPYAFQYLSPIERKLGPRIPSAREFPILRILAAPGVAVNKRFAPRGGWLGAFDPFVEVIRVQDPGLIPPLGRDIQTFNFLQSARRDPQPEGSPPSNPEHQVRVTTRRDGVDIDQPRFQQRVEVRVKVDGENSRKDAFAYRFLEGGGVWILATASVAVRLVLPPVLAFDEAWLNRPGQLRIQLTRVDDVPAFYRALEQFHAAERHTGEVVIGEPIPVVRKATLEQELAMAATETAIGFTPVVGDLYDIGQFAYGVWHGKDFFGQKLSHGQIVVLGLCAMLPFVSIGMVRAVQSGRRGLEAFGQKAHLAEELADSLKLTPEQERLVSDAAEGIRKNRAPAKALTERLVVNADFGEAPPHAITDLLNAERSGFTEPTLQEGYRAYLARRAAKSEPAADPEEWARLQAWGKYRAVLERALGKDYAKRPRSVGFGASEHVNASEVIRPQSLDHVRLETFIRELAADEAKLLERIPAERLVNGRIPKNLFGTLLGNIGEILAKQRKNEILAIRQADDPELELLENVKIRTRRNGGWSDPKLFSDGIIAKADAKGNFHITDLFEIKAGASVAGKAQGQVFDWIEDRIQHGVQIVLPDGRTFTHLPRDPVIRDGKVIEYRPLGPGDTGIFGLANARRHLMMPQGKSHLGMNSADQIAAELARHELPADPDELMFLVRLLGNTAPLRFAETAAELDYTVAEILQRLSAGVPAGAP